MQEADVYELSDAGATGPRAVFAPKIRRARRRAVESTRPTSSLPASAASLSLVVPGSGHLLVGEPTLALFFASGVLFLASLGWTIVTEIDRIVPTLDLLAVSPRAVIVVLATLLAAACVLHVGGVLHAHHLACGSRQSSAPHPFLAGLASAVVPGWGQIVVGHRARAALFLCTVWTLSGAWLVVSPYAEPVLELTGARLPAALKDGVGPIALVSLSAVTWVVAVYDAVAGAHSARCR
jgi:hypothetical protein